MSIFWKVFNKFARFIGWCFLIGGVFGFFWSLELYKHFNEGSEWIDDTFIGVLGFFAYTSVIIIGYAFLKAKPYNSV